MPLSPILDLGQSSFLAESAVKLVNGQPHVCAATPAQAQKQERQAYWKYVENLIELGDEQEQQPSSKQKRFFSFIKSLKKDSSGVAPLRDQGKLHSDPADKANILNRQ